MSAMERAYRLVRAAIVEGRIAPGARLPEEELAEMAGVSRTPVREALRRLALEGFVEVSPNRGARVLDWGERDVINVFQIRAQLEPFAAALAATNRTEEQLAELKDLAEHMFQLVEDRRIDELADRNARFHELLLEASGNPQLLQVTRPLLLRPLALRVYRHYDLAAIRRAMAYHREIANAVEVKDAPWAQATMSGHIHSGEALLRDAIRYEGDEPVITAVISAFEAFHRISDDFPERSAPSAPPVPSEPADATSTTTRRRT
jgi:DNA-binding GntR family transcriptional regulator